jgi:hypothetical protein
VGDRLGRDVVGESEGDRVGLRVGDLVGLDVVGDCTLHRG